MPKRLRFIIEHTVLLIVLWVMSAAIIKWVWNARLVPLGCPAITFGVASGIVLIVSVAIIPFAAFRDARNDYKERMR